MAQFTAYAAPMTYGPKVTIGSHGGEASFKISFSVQGDTVVDGRVHYAKRGADGKISESLVNGGTILTSNSFGNIEVDFKGSPLGSEIRITVES